MGETNFIDLGVAFVNKTSICAVAVADVPANPTHVEFYTVQVFLHGIAQPIVIPYEKVEDRDAVYSDLKAKLA